MKTIAVILVSTFLFSSCTRRTDKEIKAIYSQSADIFASTTVNFMAKGYTINIDSLLNEYTRISAVDPESGLAYARRLSDYFNSMPVNPNEDEKLQASR